MGHEVFTHQQATNYRVEVSGWDASEAFFCEKAILVADSAAQQICLRAALRKGTVIFVQLLQPFETDENFPVAYLVANNLPVEMNGRTMVSITRMHATPSYRQSVTPFDAHRRFVA